MSNMKRTSEMYPELRKIENDIQALRILVVKSRRMPRKIVKLEGLLKKVKVQEEDIEKAKKAVFKFSD